MSLATKIAEKQKALEEERSKLSPDDAVEITERAKLDELEKAIEAERNKQAQLALDRRLDAAREVLGPNASIRGVMIEGYPDTFIVKRNQGAHSRWLDAVAKAAAAKESKEPANRSYAAAGIYDWNGRIGADNDPQFQHDVTKFLQENAGIVTPITNDLAELAGVFARERKS